MQAAHQGNCQRKLIVRGGQLTAKQREFAIRQHVEMFVGDGHGKAHARRVGMQGAQL
jgi:hypothetical protein